jgi:hypothetical protein
MYAQLGNGTIGYRTVPGRVGSDTDWAEASAYSPHAIGLKKDGSLWIWGSNDHGALGSYASGHGTTPVRLGTDTDWMRCLERIPQVQLNVVDLDIHTGGALPTRWALMPMGRVGLREYMFIKSNVRSGLGHTVTAVPTSFLSGGK